MKKRIGNFFVIGALVVIVALYFFVVATVLRPGDDGTPEGILKGWGDVAYHLNMIETLAEGGLTRLEQPIAAGTSLTYPFFINWVSAGLRVIGFSVFDAFHIPAFLFGGLLVLALWLLGREFLRQKSLAVIFIAVVLFGGGLGFFQFFLDVAAGEPFAHEYTHLDDRTGGKLYGMDAPHNIVWITPSISFFSHQRAFIPGAALGALILWGVLKRRWWWISAVGLLPIIHTHTFLAFVMILAAFALEAILRDVRVGRLFRAVAHRFGEKVRPLLGSRFFGRDQDVRVHLPEHIREESGFALSAQPQQDREGIPLRVILLYGTIAAIIALPQVFYLLWDKSGGTLFEWWPGWMAKGQENVLWFWTKNFGVVFWGWVVALAVMVWSVGRGCMLRMTTRRSVEPARSVHGSPLRSDSGQDELTLDATASDVTPEDRTRDVPESSPSSSRPLFLGAQFSLVVASLVLFAAAHLVKFQPWEFDNNKVIFWWWLLAALIALSAIGKVIELRRKLGIALLVFFTFFATFAGLLDVSGRFIRIDKLLFGYYGQSEIYAAEWIRANTLPGDAFLTADNPNNFVPMLAGRPIYLGFTGWLWSHGNEAIIAERRDAIAQFLAGDWGTVCRDGVRYVVWDAQFEFAYPDADKGVVGRALKPVFEQPGRTIYRLLCDLRASAKD